MIQPYIFSHSTNVARQMLELHTVSSEHLEYSAGAVPLVFKAVLQGSRADLPFSLSEVKPLVGLAPPLQDRGLCPVKPWLQVASPSLHSGSWSWGLDAGLFFTSYHHGTFLPKKQQLAFSSQAPQQPFCCCLCQC